MQRPALRRRHLASQALVPAAAQDRSSAKIVIGTGHPSKSTQNNKHPLCGNQFQQTKIENRKRHRPDAGIATKVEVAGSKTGK